MRYMEDKAVPPMCTCERCTHEWKFKGPEAPNRCPKCKSAFWDKPYRSEAYKSRRKIW